MHKFNATGYTVKDGVTSRRSWFYCNDEEGIKALAETLHGAGWQDVEARDLTGKSVWAPSAKPATADIPAHLLSDMELCMVREHCDENAGVPIGARQMAFAVISNFANRAYNAKVLGLGKIEELPEDWAKENCRNPIRRAAYDRPKVLAACAICRGPLNIPGDPATKDCGGDCLRCMAEAGDPDAIKALDGPSKRDIMEQAITHLVNRGSIPFLSVSHAYRIADAIETELRSPETARAESIRTAAKEI